MSKYESLYEWLDTFPKPENFKDRVIVSFFDFLDDLPFMKARWIYGHKFNCCCDLHKRCSHCYTVGRIMSKQPVDRK